MDPLVGWTAFSRLFAFQIDCVFNSFFWRLRLQLLSGWRTFFRHEEEERS